MVVAGGRSPWLKAYIVLAATVALLLASYVSLGEPTKDVSKLKHAAVDAAVDHMCASDDVYNFKVKYPLKDRPKDKKVVALLFAGRKHYVQILECYMRRNLVKNGGWLDNVVWIIHTQVQNDIDFLEKVINEVPEYSQHIVQTYDKAYLNLDPDTTYVKIDDDVVFMEDHTIPAIVTKLNNHPEYSLVSANVMNQPALSWVHYHLGAIRPYLPELEPPTDFIANRTEIDNWRLSTTPTWQNATKSPRSFNVDDNPPFKGHRWLRLPESTTIVEDTPVGVLGDAGKNYHGWGKGWNNWAVAAQQHYSFLENLERGQLWRYKFDTWYYHFERLSINFIAFNGDLLINNPMPNKDDEKFLTVVLPRNLSRPAVLDGTGMVVHFGFGPQGKGLNDTDLLLRYQNFADEYICGKPIGSPRP